MEADGKAKKWGPRPVLPPLLPKGDRGQFFYLDALAAVAVGALCDNRQLATRRRVGRSGNLF